MDPDEILDWAKRTEPSIINDTIAKYADDLSGSMGFNLKIDMRSYLRHAGINNLGKSKIEYALQDWHRGYKPEEIKKVLSYLDSPIHKLYVLIAIETGLRANTILALRYRHVQEDLEANVIPCAVRLEPKFYTGKKSAGFCFLGARSLALLKECIKNGLVSANPDAFIFSGRSAGEPSSYAAMYDAVSLAKQKAGLDPKIQVNHGLRKAFENALDQSGIDHEYKMMIEGHFIGARGKHYTAREWDILRPIYAEAYPHLDVEGSNPDMEKKVASMERDMQSQINAQRDEINSMKEVLKRDASEKEIIAELRAMLKIKASDQITTQEIKKRAHKLSASQIAKVEALLQRVTE
jgi:integrase